MAERLGLSGWVRNLPGGEVEITAVGDPRKLAELEAWLWVGPAHARVAEVVVTAASVALGMPGLLRLREERVTAASAAPGDAGDSGASGNSGNPGDSGDFYIWV